MIIAIRQWQGDKFMDYKMQRIMNLLIGIFLIIFGAYFIYLCAIDPEAQIRTLRHPTGEDFSQSILSAICGLGGIICGVSHLRYLSNNIDKKQ